MSSLMFPITALLNALGAIRGSKLSNPPAPARTPHRTGTAGTATGQGRTTQNANRAEELQIRRWAFEIASPVRDA
ncbi:MAG: hypothetical protein ACREGL_06930 [Alphaproteobacteria bacterium]